MFHGLWSLVWGWVKVGIVARSSWLERSLAVRETLGHRLVHSRDMSFGTVRPSDVYDINVVALSRYFCVIEASNRIC